MGTDISTDYRSAAAAPAESREQRLTRERAIIAQGEAEMAAGLYFDFDELEAWFDRLEIDRDAVLPLPPVRSQ